MNEIFKVGGQHKTFSVEKFEGTMSSHHDDGLSEVGQAIRWMNIDNLNEKDREYNNHGKYFYDF